MINTRNRKYHCRGTGFKAKTTDNIELQYDLSQNKLLRNINYITMT